MGTKRLSLEITFNTRGEVVEVHPKNDLIILGDLVSFQPYGPNGTSPSECSVKVNGAEIPFTRVKHSLEIKGARQSPSYDNKLYLDTYDISLRGNRIVYRESGEGNGEVVDTSVSEFYAVNAGWIDKVQNECDTEKAPTQREYFSSQN